jgi:hypothetical protein
MRINTRTTIIAIGAGLAVGASANAGVSFFSAVINNNQAVPMTDSPATGTLEGTYDSDTNTFEFSWTITPELVGLPASPGAHIHDGDFGDTGPIVFGFSEPDGTWDLSGSATWTDLSEDDVSSLFDNGLYVNFHTTEFPSGEVRGQINLVPTPGSVAVLGIAGLAFSRRRR